MANISGQKELVNKDMPFKQASIWRFLLFVAPRTFAAFALGNFFAFFLFLSSLLLAFTGLFLMFLNLTSNTTLLDELQYRSILVPALITIQGFFYMMISFGLFKRRYDIWIIAIIFTCFSIIVNALRFTNISGVLFWIIILVILLATKKSYKVRAGNLWNKKVIFRYIIFFIILLVSYTGGLIFLTRNSDDSLNIRTTIAYLTEDIRHPNGDIDTDIRQSTEKFENIIAVLLLLLGSNFIFELFKTYRTIDPKLTSDILTIYLRKYGSDTLDYFSTNYKKSHFVSKNKKACLAYSARENIVLASGEPVCSPRQVRGFLEEFLRTMHERGYRTAFISIGAKYKDLYKSLGYKVIKVGEEAVVDIQAFDINAIEGKKGRKLRRAVKNIENFGISYEFYTMRNLPAIYYSQIQELDKSWIKEFGEGSGERGFSMTLSRVPNSHDLDCGFGCAIDNTNPEHPNIIAYISMAPVYKQNSYSLDMMRRKKEAPNGINEFLIVHTLETLQEHGRKKLSLNFALFANTNNEKILPVERLSAFLPSSITKPFYLDTLFEFNDKFKPNWESRYLAYERVSDFPQVMRVIAELEGSISLDWKLAIARLLLPSGYQLDYAGEK